jgi:hypothetical protein
MSPTKAPDPLIGKPGEQAAVARRRADQGSGKGPVRCRGAVPETSFIVQSRYRPRPHSLDRHNCRRGRGGRPHRHDAPELPGEAAAAGNNDRREGRRRDAGAGRSCRDADMCEVPGPAGRHRLRSTEIEGEITRRFGGRTSMPWRRSPRPRSGSPAVYRAPRRNHCAIEPHAVTAEGDALAIHATLSALFGLPRRKSASSRRSEPVQLVVSRFWDGLADYILGPTLSENLTATTGTRAHGQRRVILKLSPVSSRK